MSYRRREDLGKVEKMMSGNNSLLFDSHPLIIIPELANILGLNEAIVIQQIHYWLEINRKAHKNFYDGVYWTYNTYEDWQLQFPFWSIKTIKTTMKKLECQGLILTGNYNKLKMDRTKWYTINYEAFNEKISKCKSCPTIVQDLPNGKCKVYPTNTIEYTKNSSEIIDYMEQNSNEILPDFNFFILNKQIEKAYNELFNNTNDTCPPYDLAEYIKIFRHFYVSYYNYIGRSHPFYKTELIKEIMNKLPSIDDDIDVSLDDNLLMIDAYFNQPWDKNIDPTIAHFCSGNIRVLRFYEKCY